MLFLILTVFCTFVDAAKDYICFLCSCVMLLANVRACNPPRSLSHVHYGPPHPILMLWVFLLLTDNFDVGFYICLSWKSSCWLLSIVLVCEVLPESWYCHLRCLLFPYICVVSKCDDHFLIFIQIIFNYVALYRTYDIPLNTSFYFDTEPFIYHFCHYWTSQ